MEILDIVDEKGNPTGDTVERSLAHREGIPHRTSHVWVLRYKDGNLQVLLQKRSKDKDSHPLEYDCSSAGHIPAGFGFEESAIRELCEELGLQINIVDLNYCGNKHRISENVFYGHTFKDNQYSNIYYIYEDKDSSEFNIQKEELEEVQWFDANYIIGDISNPQFPNCIDKKELELVIRSVSKSKNIKNKNSKNNLI